MGKKLDINLKGTSVSKRGQGSSAGVATLLGYMLGQQKSLAGQAQVPGEVPVGRTDPLTGVRTETPESVSRRKYTKEDVSALSASDAFTRSRDFIISAINKDPIKFRESFAKANINIPGLTQPQTRGNIKGYPTVAGDQLAINIQRELDNMSDLLLRLRSGAQINEQEFQRLRGLLPTYKDITVEVGENGETFPTIRRSLNQFENDLAIAKKRTIQGGYYDAQFWEDQPSSSPIPGMTSQINQLGTQDDPKTRFLKRKGII